MMDWFLNFWYWQALDLVPTKIHERSPIFLGSYDDVEEIKVLYAAEEKKEWSSNLISPLFFALLHYAGSQNTISDYYS